MTIVSRLAKVRENTNPMANVLIVHAHPEPASFSSALAATAAATLSAAGHRVAVSDLYAMAFNPVSSRANVRSVADPNYFKQQHEERLATDQRAFAPELESEMQKLEAADLLIFSFPLWWFGLPAILKGWTDRVIAYHRFYGRGHWYDTGFARGRKALVIMTTGSGPESYQGAGPHPLIDTVLAPIHHGIFWFNGYSVLTPFIAWSPAHISAAARAELLTALHTRLHGLTDEIGTPPPPAHPPSA